MANPLARRDFLRQSAIAGAAIAGGAVLQGDFSLAAAPAPAGTRPPLPKMLLGGKASLSEPVLAPSQLSFRIGLARARTAAYPMDSMDFILMDLERPAGRSRHAHWCAGDLTGRLLEFLSCSDGIDGTRDARIGPLLDRILKQRRPSGILGRYAASPVERPPEEDPLAGANRLFCGLIRCFDLTGDARAIEAAEGMAGRLWSVRDGWRERLKSSGGRFIEAWVSEPFARLYALTRDPRWLEFCGMIREHLGTCEAGCHAHGFMSTLRGLQVAALVTGDRSWNDKPEQNRRLVIEKRFEMPDGCTPEAFPRSARNEGCSIADWLMLNLNAGLILGDDAAYEKAERIFWNALAFNQWITGCFGHRGLTANGYGLNLMEEAWWCCVHEAGMAMTDYARHAVTFRDGAVRVNLLVPGRFTVPLPGGQSAKVTIATAYPARAEATIEAEGLPADMPLRLRVPGCVRKPEVTETRLGQKVSLVFRGRLGHRIEACRPGMILTFGPLVLVPAMYSWDACARKDAAEAAVPNGYVPESIPAGMPSLKIGGQADSDGFVSLPAGPRPEWSYFDEGPGARTWVEGAAVTVPLKFPDGQERSLRFTPMCYNTSNLTLCETPVVFRDG